MLAPPVPAALRPYVAARIPYDTDYGAAGIHRGLPATTLTLVLPVDDPIAVSWAGKGEQAPRTSWSSLSGLHAAPAAIHHNGLQRGVFVTLTAAGARALLGMPAAALAGELSDLDEALPVVAELPERLHGVASWSGRVALVDRTLVRLLDRFGDRGPRAEVGRALAALTAGARVESVAAEVGYSRRRLGDLVRAECGVTPKTYQRIARFEAAKAALVGGPSRSLADVAAGCGYSDHAHLTREWVALAGCAPSVWLREEFPFVQAADDPDEEH